MQNLKNEFEQLRKENIPFIAVANSEWYSLFKDEIRNSIAIEGIFTNRNELLDVLEHNKRTDTQKTAAILGYFESASSVYEYANNLLKENEFKLRLADIKQIHSLLMRYEKQVGTFQGTLGDFRKGDIEVTESRFTPIKASFLEQVMKLFVKWTNEKLDDADYDKLQLAAISHVLFETIHPFRDGNGRVGRILLSFILIGCGYVNIAIKGTNKEDRNRYYDALETADDQCELLLRAIETGKKISTKDMDRYLEKSNISFFSKIIEERLRDAYDRLKSKDTLKYNQDALLPLRDVAKFYHYSQDYLRNLINKGKLAAQRSGKLWYVRVQDIEKYRENVEKNN